MIVVLVVALDCATISSLLTTSRFDPILTDLLVVAILPAANMLVFGLLLMIPQREGRPERRAFVVGFEVCGGLVLGALLSLIFGSVSFRWILHEIPMRLSRHSQWLAPGPGLASAAALMYFLPQLAIALLGGHLFRRSEILR
jgi:hypothetical protein